MKTRTYLQGCTWCQGTGSVPTQNSSTGTTEVCPVCNGAKTVTVTEIEKQDHSLWDEFAKQAIPVFFTKDDVLGNSSESVEVRNNRIDIRAKSCYKIADAMLRQREKNSITCQIKILYPSSPDLVGQMIVAASLLDLEFLKGAHQHMRDRAIKYDAIGIMDGTAYPVKRESLYAGKVRIEAIINLVEVLRNTNDKIIPGDELAGINELFEKSKSLNRLIIYRIIEWIPLAGIVFGLVGGFLYLTKKQTKIKPINCMFPGGLINGTYHGVILTGLFWLTYIR